MNHGTLDGYRRHRKEGTTPCDLCRHVYERLYGPDEPRADGQPIRPWHPSETLQYERAEARRQVQNERWHGPPHGTLARYKRHHYEGTDPCESCKAANREYVRSLRARQQPR